MIETIVFIGGPLSGRAEPRPQLAGSPEWWQAIEDFKQLNLQESHTIVRESTMYRLAGSVETAGHDETVYVYYVNDPLAAVRQSHLQCALSFMSTVAVSSSAAVAMTMWLCSIRQYTFCTHTTNEIATDHVDAFCEIILRSQRFQRLAAKGRRDATYSELYHEFMKK